MDDYSLWTEASRDVEAETALRSLTSARVRVAGTWPFLAAATDEGDFDNRLALVEAKIEEAADGTGTSPVVLAQSLRTDWQQLVASRKVGSFYVETGDGEKVGGPYDTKDAAQEAIDGGDVTGDGLKVAEGDDDSDDDSEDEPKGDSEDAEGEDADADHAEGDDNPFDEDGQRKESKVAYNDAEVSQYSSEVANQRADFGTGVGSHPVPDHLMHREQEVMSYRNDARQSHSPDTHCNSCGKFHDSGELHTGDDACPHCGADERHMEPLAGARDYHRDAEDPHYGDDYTRQWQASLFPVVALAEGQDPLERIVQSVPGGEGQAEKEIHHGEYDEHPDNSLVNQFTSVYKKFAG